MKALFEKCYEEHFKKAEERGDNIKLIPLLKDNIISIVDSEGLFDDLDVKNKHGDLMKFGNLLKSYNQRILNNIKMETLNPEKKFGTNKFTFSKKFEQRKIKTIPKK